jgi:hypothetical protein
VNREQVIAMGFKRLDSAAMFCYLEENEPGSIKDFMAAAFMFYKVIPVLDESGNPVIAKKRAKTTLEPITDSAEIAKLKRAGQKPRFNTLAAKYWFCDRFFPEMLPTNHAKSASAAFYEKYKRLL